jgi:hypothetical protein
MNEIVLTIPEFNNYTNEQLNSIFMMCYHDYDDLYSNNWEQIKFDMSEDKDINGLTNSEILDTYYEYLDLDGNITDCFIFENSKMNTIVFNHSI